MGDKKEKREGENFLEYLNFKIIYNARFI